MTFWILLWKAQFIVCLTAFAGMSVWVTIGGWQDIKSLFRQLDQEHQKKESPAPAEDQEPL
jgi:hypothetical protein